MNCRRCFFFKSRMDHWTS